MSEDDQKQPLEEGSEFTFIEGKYRIKTGEFTLYIDLDNLSYLTLARIEDDEFYKHI